MRRKPIRSNWIRTGGRFLLYFLPVVSMLLLLSVYIYHVELATHEEALIKNETSLLSHLNDVISSELHFAVSDLFSLSEFHELYDLINNASDHPRPLATIARDWLALSKRKQVYDQIRYLDESGQEIVRINYNQDNPVHLPAEQLQNKASRYYFTATMKLQAGEIYVSPFDLNMEGGQIERPLKPMLRIATPVFDRDGNRRGIVILNYSGNYILNALREALGNRGSGSVMLLNKEGYWLLGPDPQREWGFMFGKEETLQRYDNDAWKKINAREGGRFHHNGKQYFFTTIRPLKNALLPENKHRNTLKFGRSGNEREFYWKIISVFPEEFAKEGVRNLYRMLVVINVTFCVLTALVSIQLFLAGKSRRRSLNLLQESETRFRQAEAIASFGCWEWDFAGKNFVCSDGHYRLLGYNPDETTLSYATFIERIHPDDRKKLKTVIKYGLKGGGGHSLDYRVVLPDGSQRTLREQADISYNENGQPLRMLGTVRDITRQKEMETALRAAKDAAENSARAKSAFLANMSHEIRTPMNAILGLSHLLLGTELTSKQDDYLSKVDSSAKTLLKIIDNILDYSKIEAGKLSLEETLFDLDELMMAVLNITGVKGAEKDLELLFRIAPKTPLHLIGDPVRLQQILVNLVGNSVKFTETGEVVVSVEPAAPRNGNIIPLKFVVRDTGIGMNEQQIDKLFEAFSQADSSITRKYGGTGLGLTICQRLLHLMGSELHVTSIAGSGSEFFFTLPCTIGHEDERSFHADDLIGKRVLVVDDSPTPREILRELLESFELEVKTADSGHEALQRMEAAECAGRPYEIVFLDWRMPDMDGVETYRRIIDGKFSFVPKLLLVSAYDYESSRAPGIFDGYLNKPTTPEILLNKLLAAYRSVPQEKTNNYPADDTVQIMFSGERILLAEDNDINQIITSELLRKVGLHVVIAVDGCEALDRVQNESFDLVLMDIQMPRMDGLTAIRKIRELPGCAREELPILALTAHAMIDDCAHSLDAGANDHLTKPIDPERLYAALLQWLKTEPAATQPEFSLADTATPKNKSLPAALPGLNLADALTRQGGDADFVLRVAEKFRTNHAETVAAIRKAYLAGDRETATRLAHTMKSVGGYVGANGLQQIASRLEESLKSGERNTDALLDLFEDEMNVVMTSLAKLEQPT